jgi:hypothetical protein
MARRGVSDRNNLRSNPAAPVGGAWRVELSSGLQHNKDWPLLKELWTAVVAKRGTNYNKTKTAQKSVPEKGS